MSYKPIYEKARELLTDRDHWGKFYLFQDEDGEKIHPDDPNEIKSAHCMCILGALYIAKNNQPQDVLINLVALDLQRFLPPQYTFMVEFNDFSNTCHEDVLALLDRAIKGT